MFDTSLTPTLSVSQLNSIAGELVEQALGDVQVEGEVSNFTASASGHWYFTLKDAQARVSCVLFGVRRNAGIHGKPPANGDYITVSARANIYKAYGSFQLVVSQIRMTGQGRLLQQIAELQHRLAAQGLFDQSSKQTLPELCQCIGVVTSASGAALTDITNTCARRAPYIRILVYPCLVQGEGAPGSITCAIELAGQHNQCQALIVGRGGGSLEDLMAFNHEQVVRAIHACPLPVVSAVGHQRDLTLADMAADERAATPTAAAELLSTHKEYLLQRLDELASHMGTAVQGRIDGQANLLQLLGQRLVHPGLRIERASEQLQVCEQRLNSTMAALLDRATGQLKSYQLQLKQLNPASVLERGYSLVSDANNKLVVSAARASKCDELRIAFADGKLAAVPKGRVLSAG